MTYYVYLIWYTVAILRVIIQEAAMEEIKGNQIERVLQIYSRLSDGYIVNKTEEAARYGVNERSIQRDIDHIRNLLDEDSERTGIVNSIVYDRSAKGYRLESGRT